MNNSKSKKLNFKIFFYFLIIFSLVSLQKLASQTHGNTSPGENGYMKKYQFTADWFSSKIPLWKKIMQPFKGKPNIHYLEIGVFEGRSAFWMLENVLTHPTSKLTCIDIFPEDVEERFNANLKKSGFKNKVTAIKGMSQQVLKGLDENSFDIIYVDGGHTADDVLADAVFSWPLLKKEGIMIFDDYLLRKKEDPPQMRPQIAIDAFITAYLNHIEIVHHGYQVVLKKRKKSDSNLYYFQQYVYDWLKKELYLAEKMEPIKLSEAEKRLIEKLIKSREFGKTTFTANQEMFADKLFINLRNRLKLDVKRKKVVW